MPLHMNACQLVPSTVATKCFIYFHFPILPSYFSSTFSLTAEDAPRTAAEATKLASRIHSRACVRAYDWFFFPFRWGVAEGKVDITITIIH